MRRNKLIIILTFSLTLLVSGIVLFLPTPATWPPDTVNFHRQLIMNIYMAGTHVGATILFLANLDVYKTKLRFAYVVLAIGVFFTGIGTLQISLLTLFNAWNNPYAQSGATMLPFLLSGLILYLAVRSFALLVDVRGALTKLWLVVPAVLLLAVGAAQLPHAPDPGMLEISYDLVVGIMTWSGIFMLVASWLAIQVRHHAGAHYETAITWLVRALVFSALVMLYQGGYTLINLGYNPLLNLISNIILIISGLIWIRAGYSFALTKYYSRDVSLLRYIFRPSEPRDVGGPTTVPGMVIYAAGLVSNEPEVVRIVENVRAVTTRLKPGEYPSPAETEMLVGAYLEIERYLVNKEPLRKFTVKELRSRLTPELRRVVASYE